MLLLIFHATSMDKNWNICIYIYTYIYALVFITFNHEFILEWQGFCNHLDYFSIFVSLRFLRKLPQLVDWLHLHKPVRFHITLSQLRWETHILYCLYSPYCLTAESHNLEQCWIVCQSFTNTPQLNFIQSSNFESLKCTWSCIQNFGYFNKRWLMDIHEVIYSQSLI